VPGWLSFDTIHFVTPILIGCHIKIALDFCVACIVLPGWVC